MLAAADRRKLLRTSKTAERLFTAAGPQRYRSGRREIPLAYPCLHFWAGKG